MSCEMGDRRAPRAWALLALALLAPGCGEPEGDPLVRLAIPVTGGAAAGYVPDESCARCHSDLYASFQEVGMARSFYRPRADRMIEDFDAGPFHHPASGRYYRMARDGDALRFERWELDAEGRPIHGFEVAVDWILGSGHTSRTYLFRVPGGELYQLPIAWYTQTGRWGMAPGFDFADHGGVERRVARECMFCHNAYPEVAAGFDDYGAPHRFPTDLPQGIGCQRCHGPGAEHVRAALGGDEPAARATIVHPGRLPPRRAVEICYGCHFQPSAALAGVRRFGRGTYSFRPGEPLDDYLAVLDVDEERQSREERFEINHHPYRLEQSACFRESEPGALACTRCHDPHRKVPARRRQAHYRDACLSCHQVDACSLDAMADAAGLRLAGLGEVAADDCAACHMSRRRTQDVIEVVMTDHLIRRLPGGPELLAPLEETVPVLIGAEPVREVPGIPPDLEEIYKACAVIRAGGSPEATRFLARALPGRPLSSPDPLIDLIRGLLGRGSYAEAEEVATVLLGAWPEHAEARNLRAFARLRQGDHEAALADLDASLATAGELPEPLYGRGLVLLLQRRDEEAAEALGRAVELRPNYPRAWLSLGRARERLGSLDEAETAFRRALAVDPADPRATVALGRLLARGGRRADALRILEHGSRHARRPEEVRRALEEVQGEQQNDAATLKGPSR